MQPITHASIPKEERVGVVDNLLRLGVGVKNIEDLLEDLEQALRQLPLYLYFLILSIR
jgi:cystathionine gamma-lyase